MLSFEMPTGHPNGDVKELLGYMNLQHGRGQGWQLEFGSSF